MKKLTFVGLIFLCGCTTPATVLENPKTGQIARCGGNVSGSLAGGAIGYHIQKDNDDKCVQGYKDQGLKLLRRFSSHVQSSQKHF